MQAHHYALARAALSLALLGLPSAIPSRSVQAQDSAGIEEIPGFYAAGRCQVAPFPDELPALDSVLDSATLAASLQAIGVQKRLVLALRFGAFQSGPRVRVIEQKVPSQVADQALHAVESTLRSVPPDRRWAFRLRIEPGQPNVVTLERSQVCGGLPGPRQLTYRTFAVPANELAQVKRDAQEAAARRERVRFRALVDSEGRVLDVQVTASSGDVEADRTMAEALRKRGFTAATLDGNPIAAWIELKGDK